MQFIKRGTVGPAAAEVKSTLVTLGLIADTASSEPAEDVLFDAVRTVAAGGRGDPERSASACQKATAAPARPLVPETVARKSSAPALRTWCTRSTATP